MKKIVLLLSALLLMCACFSAHAIELTDEYIAQHGIPAVDEYGDETILIPLGRATPTITYNTVEYDNSHGNCLPSGSSKARHVHYYDHEHSLSNFTTSYNLYNNLPATAYAAEGAMVSKSISTQVTFTAGISIVSGVELEKVKRELSFEFGASVTFGAGETYSFGPVPEGYLGRIVYRVFYNRHFFMDTITYYINGSAWEDNYTDSETITNFVDELSDRDGYFYLQLKPV